ncbi:MAG: hypothetical protein IH608_01885 [Proteobacteria bacterium]|nr:hypothetical protein [Pseudomonadota bacterium]
MSSQRRENIRLVTQFSAGALELGVSIAVGAFIGVGAFPWVKARFGEGAAYGFALVWFLAGVFAGFRSLLRVLRKFQQEDEQGGNGGAR